MAIYLSFLVAILLLRKSLDPDFLKILVLGLFIICALGLIDDIKRMSTKIRLGVQIIAALIPISFGLRLNSIDFPMLGTLRLGLLALPITLIWILWLTNLYNFMDGIDGLAGAEAATVSFFLVLLSSRIGDTSISYLNVLILGGSLGFLVHNWPPAKIFMGDVGSYFYGFFFSVVAVYSSQNQHPGIPFLIFVLLLGTFIIDTTVTLMRRILKRERWFDAHRSHYYQRLVISGYGHGRVTLLECGLTSILGLGAIAYMAGNEWTQALVIGCSLLLLVGGIILVVIREKQKIQNIGGDI